MLVRLTRSPLMGRLLSYSGLGGQGGSASRCFYTGCVFLQHVLGKRGLRNADFTLRITNGRAGPILALPRGNPVVMRRMNQRDSRFERDTSASELQIKLEMERRLAQHFEQKHG